jgi:hypothetical protein
MYFMAAKYIYSWLFGNTPLFSFLKKHFGKSPERYPIVQAKFPRFRHPCLALALSRYMKQPGVSVKVVGTSTDVTNVNLSELMHPDIRNKQLEGPVRSCDIVLSNKKNMSFASHGLYLIKGVSGKFAVWISQAGEYDEEVVLEVISKDRKTCTAPYQLCSSHTLASQLVP